MATRGKTTRRGWGEHSIYQRESDGLWVASMELGRDAEGKRQRITRAAKTKREAKAKLDAAKRQHTDTGFVPDQRRTLAEYLDWWGTEVLPGTVKASTADGYRWLMAAYVTPHIGHRPLAQLDPADVQRVLRKLEAEGKSPRTRRQVRAVLRSALTRAERFGYVTRNAAALVDAPKAEGQQRTDDTLTVPEVRKLLEQLADDRLGALAELALRLGPRKGELQALRWSDVDLKAGTLRIGGTLKRRPGGGTYIDEPKTSAGIRVVPLTAHLVDVLRRHRGRQGEERLAAGELWSDGGFVFTSSHGAPLDERNVLRWWHATLDDAGIAPRPFHATRRTAVTHMAEAGVPLEVAAKLVGHSSIRVTADIYNRVRPKAQADALALLEAHLGS